MWRKRQGRRILSVKFMDMALQEASAAAERGEVPVGAVLVQNGEVLAREGNRTLEFNDPTGHAEILVIRRACEHLNSQRLPDCDLYVTLEPCAMCAGAISFARIRRLYFGAEDAKGGAVQNGTRFFEQATCHHSPDWYSGISERAAARLLKEFFQTRR
jgi:tRNA(Arg) A34 adenosine deaminase TadA